MTETASSSAEKKKAAADNSKNSVGLAYLKILGNGAPGDPASFYVVTDHSCYVFNCGEGFQRLAREAKMRFTKLENIFITRNTWDMMGGLPGVAFAQDGQVPSVTLHGPPGLLSLFDSAADFIYTPNLKLEAPTCLPETFFEDHVMRVDYLPIDSHQSLKAETSSLNSMCFICKMKDTPGSLQVDRCRQKGVPSGPLLGKLKAGHDVTLEDGTIVTSAEVTSASTPGPIFIVIDCPTEDHVQTLVTMAVWSKFQKRLFKTTDTDPDHLTPSLMVHFTPSNILCHPDYILWINSFHSETKHIILNEFCEILKNDTVHQLQCKLNSIDSKIFPLLYPNGNKTLNNDAMISTDDHQLSRTKMFETVPEFKNGSTIIIFPDSPLAYHLRPHLGLKSSSLPAEFPKTLENEHKAFENDSNFPTNFENDDPNRMSKESDENFPKILFLGTGSCVPSSGRNVSGILVEMTKTSKMFLDCGEGSYGQLVRFFGLKKTKKILRSTHAIYISHLHADHHLGLLTLLQKRLQAFDDVDHPIPMKPLFLIAPHEISKFLTDYNKNFEDISKTYKLIPNLVLTNDYDESQGLFDTEEMLDSLNLKSIQTVLVDHCPSAFGVALQYENLNHKWKITYSGDTVPCPDLVDLGLNSDLLIHEATMEDELIEDAEAKKHSTTSQAIQIGKDMNAKFSILTHFSQRYPKVPKIDDSDGLPQDVGIAFDNLRISLHDLPRLSSMYPQLKILFADDYEMMTAKTDKKIGRREEKFS